MLVIAAGLSVVVAPIAAVIIVVVAVVAVVSVVVVIAVVAIVAVIAVVAVVVTAIVAAVAVLEPTFARDVGIVANAAIARNVAAGASGFVALGITIIV